MKRVFLAIAVALLAAGCGSTRHAASTTSPGSTTPAATPASSVSVPKCPPRPPTLASHAGATSQFVRPGAGVIRLCRYYGLNAPTPLGLAHERAIVDAATVSSLTGAFNSLTKIPRGAVYHCPMDDGSAILVLFGYSGASPERVVVSLLGCRFAYNGSSGRFTTSALRSRLLALTRP